MLTLKAILNESVPIPSGNPASRIQPATSSPCEISQKLRELVDDMFLKFAVFYGNVWRSQFKNADLIQFAKLQWCEGLVKYDEKVIQREILRCRDQEEYPPTLVQFIARCRQSTKHVIRKREEPIKPSDPKMAREVLLKIKTMLGEK